MTDKSILGKDKSPRKLSEQLHIQRFDLAKKWVDFFYLDYGDNLSVPEEQLRCEVMAIIDSIRGISYISFQDSEGDIIHLLRRVGLEHHRELLEKHVDDQSLRRAFVAHLRRLPGLALN